MDINKIYCGNNMDIMGEFPSDVIDLVYLDPPFFTQMVQTIKGRKDGHEFDDKFKDMDDYIDWMRDVVTELKRVLKPTGSIYLHCDYHASHYLKVMMDGVFGRSHFQNNIIWTYPGIQATTKRYLRKHDDILFYSVGDDWTFNVDDVRAEYADRDKMNKMAGKPQCAGSTIFNGSARVAPHPLGKLCEDWWMGIQPAYSFISRDEYNYPTQKPEKLLEKIIKGSSNMDDLILDPFNGGGTTVAVAKKLGRNWIGIDQNPEAVEVTRERLSKIADQDRLHKWI